MQDGKFYYAGMDTTHLLTLAEAYGTHINRSLNVVAGRAGQHNCLFYRLKEGLGCNVATLRETFAWFSDNWPADLEWPADIPRPPIAKTRAA